MLRPRIANESSAVLEPALPALARPLYSLEAHLAALVDTEDVVPAAQEAEYQAELQRTLIETVEKRDRVGQFILHLKAQIAFAHAEASRLREREAFYQHGLERMQKYITFIIEGLGLDDKNKRRKLEGKLLTLGLHGCDKRTEVTDEAAVPIQYKRVTITLPAATWELLCDSLDLDLRDQVLAEIKSPQIEVDLAKAKSALKDGLEIAGVKLAGGTYVEVK